MINEQTLAARAQELQSLQDGLEAKDNWSPEDKAAWDKSTEELRSVAEDIERIRKSRALRQDIARPLGRITIPDDPKKNREREKLQDDPGKTVPNPGFKSVGEFLQCVANASRPGGFADDRIRKLAATTPSGESSGSDGGFLVMPTEMASEVMRHALEENALLPLTNPVRVGGNSMEFIKSETTPWGTSGVIAYWEAEHGEGTETKVASGKAELRLHKLLALAPASDELLEDSQALEDHITREAGASIRYKLNDAIVNGNGVGKPLGFVNGGSLVSQAKETSQTADTINAANVAKMFGRMPSGLISSAVWLINPDAFNQLPLMTIGDQPVWTPPNSGLTQAPGGLLLGRPVIMTEVCQTLGDAGDIYFWGPGGYKTIVKSDGPTMSLSVHAYFTSDQTVFKFRFRVDGKPWQTAAITPPNSSVTQSPFIRIDARA